MIEVTDTTNAAIAANTDENGMLTLRYQYKAVPFSDDMFLDDEAVDGSVLFQMKIH
jgi:hypothetical protein